MILRELFKKPKAALLEGGNLEIPNPKFDPAQPESELNPKVIQAQEIQLAPTEISDEVQDRTHMVGVLTKLFTDINTAFNAAYKQPLWNQKLIDTAIKDFMAGSSQHFFDLLRPNPHFDPKQPESEHNPKTIGISDEEFKKYKPKVGDIDIQCNQELQDEILDFLNNNVGRPIGNETLIGSPSQGNEQYNTLWQLANPPIKVQIDFEYGRYAPETNKPDEWTKFSHSSSWEDIQQNIKGVFHKYIYRALAKAVPSEKYIAKLTGLGKKRAMAISGPITDANFSFAVASKGGGGIRAKYKPYIDPETNQPKVIDGIPVMEPLKSDQSEYEQNLNKQFQLFFGRAPQGDDRKLQDSFVGTLELMNKYLDDQAKKKTLTDFLDIVFEPGAQMITKDDPARDYDVKFAAVNAMLTTLGLEEMRPMAEQMAKVYAQDYQDVDAFKKANPNEKQPRAAMMKQRAVAPTESIEEADEPGAQVKAQLRKGMPHLHDLKPLDLLDLLDEIHDGNGKFKLQNIPLNVKIDGFGGRFGKNANGKPFMGTSRTEPRYQAGFVAYHQKKGTTDPEILGRAKLFDDLFNEMMKVVKLVDSKLGPDYLINKQVTCEVLYLPFATETPEGKLKFVGIHYDKLPEGVQLALVPFRVVDATTGEDLPDANQVVTELTSIGQAGSVMFIDNSLTQNEALDVTAMVPPLENLEMFKAMLQDKSPGSLKRKQEVAAALEPVKVALEKAIIEDPNIIGKDKLGQDYEGIVINSRMGPIKVTSTEQRGVISAKNAAKKAAWAEQPRENNAKTAVVAIGSFAGHIGHQELFKLTQDEAASAGGDPYLFIGNAEGKDDPIPIPDKVKTWHMLYPQYAKNISAVTYEGGTLIQKIKHELINPLPGKAPRYDNIIIMVGEDRAGLNMPAALMKAVNKFPGYEHVKVTLKVTPRDTGVSFTNLRNALKTKSPEESLADWTDAFNGGSSGAAPLPADWIKHLMDVSRKGMGIQEPQHPQTPPVQQPAPVAEQRLFNALVRPLKKNAIENNKLTSQFFVRELTSEKEVVEYIRNSLIPEMRTYSVPISPNTHYTRLSSAVFEGISKVIDSGKKFLNSFERLDQRKSMKISVGSTVSILNVRLSQDFVELFGFKTPKKITKIYREPTDRKIIQLEFNNNPEDVWPRQPLASYNGKIIMTSAFFPSANAVEKALTMLSLSKPDDLTIRSNITEDLNEVEDIETDEDKEQALQFATQAHAGQTRAGGAPYISHPTNVANSIEQYKKSHNLDAIISAALLHDTVEDTHTTHEDLEALFGGLVASLVQELTSDKEKIKQLGKAQYLSQKMATMSSYALVIKLADRLDNVQDIATAKTPEWRERYKNETEQILNYIESKRVLSGTHRKFIQLIRNKLGEINDPQEQDVAEGQLSEIDYANMLDDSTFPKDKLMNMGKVDGQIEGNDVMVARLGGQTVYFLMDGEITAFIGFENGNLKNIKNFTKSAGVIRALLGYLIHVKGQTIKVSQDEPLTPDGFNWLSHLIKNPRGLNIKDQNGESINLGSLRQEWLAARTSGKPGLTGIVISENLVFGDKLRINERRRNSESILMPFNFYGVCSKKQGVAAGLNEFAQGDFNGGDDSNDLALYLNVAKKLNMKKYKPSTAHDLIAKKMAELVDNVDDDKVDWARHMARKAQGLPSMLDQQGVDEAKSAALRLAAAIQRTQGRTAAAQKNSLIPSSIPTKDEGKPEQAVAEITGDGNFDNMMGKITDPAERERLAPIEVQQVVKFLKGSIESLLELLKNDPDFEPGDVRYNTDLRDMRKNLKSIMADSDPKNVATALFNYETEWRETMNGWAEEALGHALFSKLENLYYGEYGESLAEKMLPKSAFTGSSKNKLGSAGQWKNTGPSKNRAARAGDLVGGDAQESINKTVQWKSLGEEFSVKDRMDIFEKFHAEGQLLESDEHYIKYFNNLNHYLINPTIGENYLVVPLVLIQNKLRLLDTDLSMLEFVDKQGDSVIFKTAKGQIIKYPSDQQSEVGIYKTFMFNNISTYNKFRSEVILKFNKPLPAVNIKDDKDKQVPISEDCENIMDVLINKIIVNEAIQNNRR